jgi:sulfide:quinone oxidoreductase
MKSHYQVLIIGGGTGGIMTASMLLKKQPGTTVGIIDPAEKHYYQAAWTLVGAGTFDYKDTSKNMSEMIPQGADWIKDFAVSFEPEKNSVSTKTSGEITYDYLVVSPGLVMEPSLIEGLPEALEKGIVCSNYVDPEYTWEKIKAFQGGNALFVQPSTPIKCGGAPQKTAYLAADHFRKMGINKKSNVVLTLPGSVIFGVKEVKETLEKVIQRYKIKLKTSYSPVKIDVVEKTITFKFTGPVEHGCMVNPDLDLHEQVVGESLITIPFDFLHIAPPQVAPKFIRDSPFVNESGWMDVDINTLKSKKYGNVFGIGDVAALPTAKTGAAIRKQVPVILDQIISGIKQVTSSGKIYEGYSSCPLVTGYGKMVLAEFDYSNKFIPDPKLKQMLIFDSSKEHWRLWVLKKYILPYLYWNKMMKGEEV